MNKKVVSVNRSVLYALDTITVRLKETEKQLYEANKTIEQLIKDRDAQFAEVTKWKKALLRQVCHVPGYDILEQAVLSEASEYLYKKGTFKDLGNRTESSTPISKEELFDLMTKAYEQHAKNPLGPAEYFEYDTGVRVGKVESEADTDNKKDK